MKHWILILAKNIKLYRIYCKIYLIKNHVIFKRKFYKNNEIKEWNKRSWNEKKKKICRELSEEDFIIAELHKTVIMG